MQNQDENNNSKLDAFQAKLSLYSGLVWGFLVIFSLIGFFVSDTDLPVYATLIVVTSWCVMQILHEALVCYFALMLIKSRKE